MSDLDKRRKRVLAKIRKLYAMSKETEASPHEAEVALRQCNTLMRQHGLKKEDLHESDMVKIEFPDMAKLSETWGEVLGLAAARFHDCEMLTFQDRDSKETMAQALFGYEIDVQAAMLTFDYLHDRAIAAEKLYVEPENDFDSITLGGVPLYMGVRPSIDARVEYLSGFADGVQQKVEQTIWLRKTAKEKQEYQNPHTGTSLVLIKQNNVRQEIAKITTARREVKQELFATNATNAGLRSGRDVSLNKQLES